MGEVENAAATTAPVAPEQARELGRVAERMFWLLLLLFETCWIGVIVVLVVRFV